MLNIPIRRQVSSFYPPQSKLRNSLPNACKNFIIFCISKLCDVQLNKKLIINNTLNKWAAAHHVRSWTDRFVCDVHTPYFSLVTLVLTESSRELLVFVACWVFWKIRDFLLFSSSMYKHLSILNDVVYSLFYLLKK